jgi:MFS family permease
VTPTLLGLCSLAVISTHLNISAVLPLLRHDWGLSNSQAGAIAAAGQAGFVVAVIALSALSDRWSAAVIFVGSAFCAAVSMVAFGLFASGPISAALLKALGGIGIGGTYMPGVKLVTAGAPRERGRAVGIFVASLAGGLAISLAVTGTLTAFLGWRAAFVALGLVALAGAVGAMRLLRNHRERREPASVIPKRLTMPGFLLCLAYFAHNWELMGIWGWLTAFLTASFVAAGADLDVAAARASISAFPILALGVVGVLGGGYLSDRIGRTAAAITIMLTSILGSLCFGWLIAAPSLLLVTLGALYYMFAIGDSPVLSTGVTEVTPAAGVGTALGLYGAIGWLAGALSPVLFGWVLDVTGGAWQIAFASLGVVALAGPAAMLLLRCHPASRLMAGGRR